MENVAAAPPIYIHRATCVVFPEYIKKKNVFKYSGFFRHPTFYHLYVSLRLNASDGSEYLFACENSELRMIEWVDKMNFHANLDPAHQLTLFPHVMIFYLVIIYVCCTRINRRYNSINISYVGMGYIGI